MLDTILYALIAAFVAWEGSAHYLLHNRQGHTLSNRITWIEHRGGWPVRLLVGAAVIVLGIPSRRRFLISPLPNQRTTCFTDEPQSGAA